MEKKSLVLRNLDPFEVMRQLPSLIRIQGELRQLGSEAYGAMNNATDILCTITAADRDGKTLPDDQVAMIADDLSHVMNRMFNNKILSRPDFLALSRAINFLRNGKFPMEVKCAECGD